MSKFGWNDIQDRFYLATSKLHDSEQFGFRYRELKKDLAVHRGTSACGHKHRKQR
jgi:hypothetical protein